MKQNIVTAIRDMVSPSVRYEVRKLIALFQERLGRALLWHWEVARIRQSENDQYEIVYLGRRTRRNLAIALLNADRDINISTKRKSESNGKIIVSEMPFPGALCVPPYLNSIVPLTKPVEDITSHFHGPLRRYLKNYRTHYRLQQVVDSADIERVDNEMLRPYANARHGYGAAQVGLDDIKRLAQNSGRLDLLLLGDEIVGCQLGCRFTRAGKRYWSVIRCGYPEAVFSDLKRLKDTNSMNIHLGLEWAINNGFDYYDMGMALGRPGDGLLEWKRRRGGELDTMANPGHIYIQLPRVGVAGFLWNAPLFAVEHHKLTLHLGLPDERNDNEIMDRYREMGFGGLSKVYLHCAKLPNDRLVDFFRGLYRHQQSPPVMEIIPST